MNCILNDIGWQEGKIPILNAENKAIQDEVFKLQHDLQTKRNILEDVEERIFSMSQHKKNVEQELQHTLQLINAVNEEKNTEEHMVKVCEGERGRLQQEENRINKECKTLNEKINHDENTKFKLGEDIDNLREQLKMNKKELETWLEMTAEKDEDAITLQKYRRMDESKVAELTLQINHLTDEAKNRRNALDTEATETLTAQVALDKTAEEFRRSHAERHELISRWEHTLKMMYKRDKDMDSLNNQLQNLKMEINKKKALIEEKKFFRQNEMENNKQLEDKITKVEKEGAKFRQEYQEAEAQRANFHDELEALKRTVDRTAADFEAARSQVAELKKLYCVEGKRHTMIMEQNEELTKKLQLVSECTMSAKENADQLERMLKAEEKEQDSLTQELQELRSLKYRKEQELITLQNELKFVEAKVKNNQTAIRNMNNKINRLDQDALKQEGMLYSQDLMIENLNRRVARMQGQVKTEEMSQYKSKIETLNKELEEKDSNHKILELQLNKLCDDVVKLEVHIKRHSVEMNTLHTKIDELQLHNDSSDKLLKKLIRDNQELLVKENMEKLTVKRLRDCLYDKAYQVLSQEERKLQIETTMKERQHEINIHKDMLMSQTKFAETERQEISLEYQERKAKIGKLQNRHDILMMSMSPPEGEEAKSQAYYVIKAAQEKEELQRFGDELDAKICKTEKENRALDNTIKLLNTSNESFRKSFNRVPDSCEEMAEKHLVEEKHRAVQEEIRHKRRQVREIEQDIQTMETTLENKIKENETLEEIMVNKKKQLQSVEKELDDLNIKIDRAKRLNSRYVNDIRTEKQTTLETSEEADIELRAVVKLNENTTNELVKCSQQYDPGACENLLLYLSQADITVPTTLGSGLSSTRSSVSSSATVSSGNNQTNKTKGTKQIALVDVGADFERDDASSSGSSGGSRSGGGVSGGSRAQRETLSRPVSSHSSSSSRSSRSSGQTQASTRSFAGRFKR